MTGGDGGGGEGCGGADGGGGDSHGRSYRSRLDLGGILRSDVDNEWNRSTDGI